MPVRSLVAVRVARPAIANRLPFACIGGMSPVPRFQFLTAILLTRARCLPNKEAPYWWKVKRFSMGKFAIAARFMAVSEVLILPMAVLLGAASLTRAAAKFWGMDGRLILEAQEFRCKMPGKLARFKRHRMGSFMATKLLALLLLTIRRLESSISLLGLREMRFRWNWGRA